MFKTTVEDEIRESCHVLTLKLRSSDWLMQRQIRVTSSLCERLFKCTLMFRFLANWPLLLIQENTPQSQVLFMVKNWFSRKKSTNPMMRRSNNKACSLSYLREIDILYEVFDIGILSFKKHPVLSAFPDAITMLHYLNLKEYCVSG